MTHTASGTAGSGRQLLAAAELDAAVVDDAVDEDEALDELEGGRRRGSEA